MEGPYVGDQLNIGFLDIRDCVLHDGDDRLDVVIYLGAALVILLVNIEGKLVEGVYKTGVGDQLNVGSVSLCGNTSCCPQMKTSMGKSSGNWISSCYGRSICWRPS